MLQLAIEIDFVLTGQIWNFDILSDSVLPVTRRAFRERAGLRANGRGRQSKNERGDQN